VKLKAKGARKDVSVHDRKACGGTEV